MTPWEPNNTPRIRSDVRAFCWRFFVAIPFFGTSMLIIWMISGYLIPWRDVMSILGGWAGASLGNALINDSELPVSYHFEGGILMVKYRDGSQDAFSRWVRTRKSSTGVIHAQNDRKTLEITEAMYAAPAQEREAAHNG